MKKIYLANILIFLSAFATTLSADSQPAATSGPQVAAPQSAVSVEATKVPPSPPIPQGISSATAAEMDSSIIGNDGSVSGQALSPSDRDALKATMNQIFQSVQPGQKASPTTVTPAAPSASGTPAVAAPLPDATTSDSTPEIDPTLAFFYALSTCSPGFYYEKNIITNEVGPPMLSQQIIGLDENKKITCNVKLMTPDDRAMECVFPMSELAGFSDQHFLQGMLQDTVDSPDQDSLNAGLRWSKMKSDYCGLGY